MTINYSASLDSAIYLQRLQAYMKAIEGEEFPVYIDSTGNPTIGWGFALNDAHLATINALNDIIENVLGVNKNRRDANNQPAISSTAKASEAACEVALKATLNQSWPADKTPDQTGPSTQALRAALKTILDNRAADIAAHRNGYTADDQAAIGTLATSFAYSTVDQIAATFGIIKTEIDRRLTVSLGEIPETNERIALFSAIFQGTIGGGNPTNARRKRELIAALNNPDAAAGRADAWYILRYVRNGEAYRGYCESAMFGLYSSTSTDTVAEAKSIYRTFTLHRQEMLDFDRAHAADRANANSKLAGMATAETTDATFTTAYVAIIADLNINLKASDYLSTDIYVDPGRKDSSVTFDPNYANTLKSGDKNSILIGEGGNDILSGGKGNDVLVGGTGDDILSGGAGSDTYVYKSGDGADTIIDTSTAKDSGINKIYVGTTLLTGATDRQESIDLSNGTATWNVGNGAYKYVLKETKDARTLTITGDSLGSAGNSITIKLNATDTIQTIKDRFGISLPLVALKAGSETIGGILGDLYDTVANGVARAFNLYGTGTLKLECSDPNKKVGSGAELFSFDNGPLSFTIPEGQDHITLTLIDTSNSSTSDTATLTATVTDTDGNTVTSNDLAVTFDNPNPTVGAGDSNNSGASYTYTGDHKPGEFRDELDVGAAIEPAWKWGTILNQEIGRTNDTYDSNGNLINRQVLSYIYTHYTYDDAGNLKPGAADPSREDQPLCTTGNDSIDAGNGNNLLNAVQGGNDTLIGGDDFDRIIAGNGNNVINSGAGINLVTAGNGNNTITLGNGNDQVTVGGGNNLIAGNGGQDIIMAGKGNNQLYAGKQSDLATALAQQKTALASGQQGSLLVVGDGNNTLVGGSGDDTFLVGTGNNVIIAGPGKITYTGGVETSQASPGWFWQREDVHNHLHNVQVTSAPYTAPSDYHGNTYGGLPVGGGNATIFGGRGDSVYFLSNGDNWLDAGGGNDRIQAGIGNNTIFGGVGNDTIFGMGGNNYINLESGNDYVVAGGGNNTIIGGSGNDTIFSGDDGDGWLVSQSTANNYIYGGSGNSVIYGSGGNDTLLGGTGNATIFGGDGNEYIVGGSGSDMLIAGNGLVEHIRCEAANDLEWRIEA